MALITLSPSVNQGLSSETSNNMAQAVTFYNYSTQDFAHKWDGVDYIFKAGEKYPLQDYLARHFAKHLAMREIGKRDKHKVINVVTDDYGNFLNKDFNTEVQKALTGEGFTEVTSEKLEMTIEKKKVGRPKKKEKEEIEFPDLNK